MFLKSVSCVVFLHFIIILQTKSELEIRMDSNGNKLIRGVHYSLRRKPQNYNHYSDYNSGGQTADDLVPLCKFQIIIIHFLRN